MPLVDLFRGRVPPVNPPVGVLFLLTENSGKFNCGFQTHFSNGLVRNHVDRDLDSLIPCLAQRKQVSFYNSKKTEILTEKSSTPYYTS